MRKKRVSEANEFFLQANLRTRVNYFSVIDQNNQINCLLHFHLCFTFEFLWFPTKIVPVSAWISTWRRGLNHSLSCFHFTAKIILCLKYRHKNVTKVELDYQENHTLCLCWRSYLKNANWTWKLQSDFHDFIKFSAKRQLLLLLLPITSATSLGN